MGQPRSASSNRFLCLIHVFTSSVSGDCVLRRVVLMGRGCRGWAGGTGVPQPRPGILPESRSGHLEGLRGAWLESTYPWPPRSQTPSPVPGGREGGVRGNSWRGSLTQGQQEAVGTWALRPLAWGRPGLGPGEHPETDSRPGEVLAVPTCHPPAPDSFPSPSATSSFTETVGGSMGTHRSQRVRSTNRRPWKGGVTSSCP